MSTSATNDDKPKNGLLDLFNLKSNQEVKKHCRRLVATGDNMANLAFAGRLDLLKPYRYAVHFDDIMPEHLLPTEEERRAFALNGVGPLKGDGLKMVRKVGQLFRDRRLFAAHLFYHPSYRWWYLLYFDQRDRDHWGPNHWRHGPHIHYSRETLANAPLLDVWAKICAKPPRPPASFHIRFLDPRPK